MKFAQQLKVHPAPFIIHSNELPRNSAFLRANVIYSISLLFQPTDSFNLQCGFWPFIFNYNELGYLPEAGNMFLSDTNYIIVSL